MVEHVGVQVKLHPTYKVVIVGHSLGGAMARVTQLFFIYLNQFPGTVYEIYTYGEPRVGNVHFADYINMQNITSARIVNRYIWQLRKHTQSEEFSLKIFISILISEQTSFLMYHQLVYWPLIFCTITMSIRK